MNQYRSLNGSVACQGTLYSSKKYLLGPKYGASGLSYMQAPTSAPTSCITDSASTSDFPFYRRLRVVDGLLIVIFYIFIYFFTRRG